MKCAIGERKCRVAMMKIHSFWLCPIALEIDEDGDNARFFVDELVERYHQMR